MSRQLAFDLPAREALGRGDFFVSPSNALALAALDGWRDWPGGRMLLVGPEGSGKTHLAHVWAADSGADDRSGERLARRRTCPRWPQARALVVEDADRVAGDCGGRSGAVPSAQPGGRARLPLLVTARDPAARLGAGLARSGQPDAGHAR